MRTTRHWFIVHIIINPSATTLITTSPKSIIFGIATLGSVRTLGRHLSSYPTLVSDRTLGLHIRLIRQIDMCRARFGS